jgi:hypothetical protein
MGWLLPGDAVSQVLDQLAHAGQGASVVLPHLFLRPCIASPISGGVALFWRELSQLRRSNGFKQWNIDREEGFPYGKATESWWVLWHIGDRLLDIAFGGVGGLIVGLLWEYFR